MPGYVNMMRSASALFILLLGGCSTAYQPGSPSPFVRFSSGYDEAPGPGGLTKVTYKGNESILMYQVQDYTLYRCAEIARRENSPYFMLYQTLPDALQNKPSSEVRPMTLLGLPHAEVYISLRKMAAPGALSTAEVLAKLQPTIDAGSK